MFACSSDFDTFSVSFSSQALLVTLLLGKGDDRAAVVSRRP